jgi:hypothetical protein
MALEPGANGIIVSDEVDQYFDDSSLSHGKNPKLTLLLGGPASGKTTLRRQSYSTGHVLVDAAEVFDRLCKGELLPFPGPMEDLMNEIGRLIAHRAVSEKRHIVTELIGSDREAIIELTDAMRAAGYLISGQVVTCEIEVAQQRMRDRDEIEVPCYHAEPFTRSWLMAAAST